MNFNNQLHLISYRYSLPFCVALGIGVITTSSFAAEEAEFDPSFLHSVQGKMRLIYVALIMAPLFLRASITLISISIMNGKEKLMYSIYILTMRIRRRYV